MQSYEHQQTIAGLLRFESSMTEPGKQTGFQEYVDRMKEGQEEIYFLVAPNREAIETGPYLEAFKKRGLEVCFLTESVDDYVLETLGKWGEKKIVSADRAEIDLEDVADDEGESLDEEATKGLVDWMTATLGDKVEKVAAGKRLVSHAMVALTPANAPNAQMRAMLKSMGSDAPEMKASIEVNAKHSLIKKLASFREAKPELAEKVAKQLADNALLAAGLMENPGKVVSGMSDVMEELMEG